MSEWVWHMGVVYMGCVYRYCEFLLLLYDIFVKRAQMGPSASLSAQLARLLKCSHFMDRLAPPVAPPSDHTPSSPESNTTEDGVSDDLQSLSSLMSTISLTEASIEEHPSSSSPSLEHHGTSWLHQTLCLVSIASHSSLAVMEMLHPDHLTSHVTNVASALSEAQDLMVKHKESAVIDFAPVGTPFVPAVSAAKARGRGHKGRTAKHTSSALRGDGVVKSVRMEEVKAELACGQARCLLLFQQPQQAKKILSQALAESGSECKSHELSLVRPRLHYYMGVALAQELEVEQEGVWLNKTAGHEDCVKEFLTCYQLCFPAMPTILLRDTCLWLALLLGNPYHTHHFLSLSQHISLTHQTVLSLGKKLR